MNYWEIPEFYERRKKIDESINNIKRLIKEGKMPIKEINKEIKRVIKEIEELRDFMLENSKYYDRNGAELIKPEVVYILGIIIYWFMNIKEDEQVPVSALQEFIRKECGYNFSLETVGRLLKMALDDWDLLSKKNMLEDVKELLEIGDIKEAIRLLSIYNEV